MFARIYTGPDGESHFEDLTATIIDGRFGPTALQEAQGILFTRQRPGNLSEWHTAPRRQYVIGIAGEVEIVTGDGSSMRFRPGDVLLAEDLTGRGHTTRVVGDSMRISAMVPLRDQKAPG
jgi:quercetin dioxygenase-like cupin family protein